MKQWWQRTCTNLFKRVAGGFLIYRPISYKYMSNTNTEQPSSKMYFQHGSFSADQLAFQTNISHITQLNFLALT